MTDPLPDHQRDAMTPGAGPARDAGEPADPPADPPPAVRSFAEHALVIMVVLILLTVGTLITIKGMHAQSAATPAGAAAVAVVKAERATVERSETYDGEFIADQQIELHPQVAGFVKTMLVDEGDRVRAGQILATLEIPGLDEDIARAQAQRARDQGLVAKTRAGYEQERTTSTRLEGVAGQHAGLIAQQDIDEAKARELGTQAAWQAAIGAEAVSQAELDRLLTFQRDCRIAAPFSGVVTRRYADPGALVQGGVAAGAQVTPLVTLAKTDVLRLSFPVSEAMVPRIHAGVAIAIHIGALKEDRSGTVTRFTQRVEDATRTMEVQCDVANADFRISPGMYAAITMEIERHADVLTLPHEAVRRRGQSLLVYLVGPDHRVVERAITIGLENPSRLEILSGLEPGDAVVFGSLDKAKPGQLVEARLLAEGVAPGGAAP